MKTFTGTVLRGSAESQRTADGVRVFTDEGKREFDAVVLAAHADETFKMLADPTPRKSGCCPPGNTRKIRPSCTPIPPGSRPLPSPRLLELSTGITIRKSAPLSMTYDMNILHNLTTDTHYCVT
ncbi:MAG: hypothetical protein R2875_05115 [Desulfobacterales bacterium]